MISVRNRYKGQYKLGPCNGKGIQNGLHQKDWEDGRVERKRKRRRKNGEKRVERPNIVFRTRKGDLGRVQGENVGSKAQW